MANPYDDIVAGFAGAQTPAAPDANPYDAVVDDIAAQQQKRARSVYEKALATNPDQAAEAQRLAKSTGLAPDVVERNLDEVRRKEQARLLDLARMAEDSPVLARQLMDPAFTKQAHDDVGTLTQIAQFMRDTGGSVKAGLWNANKGAAGVFRAGFEFAAPVLDVLEPVTAIGGNPLRRVAEGFAMNAEASDASAKAAAPKTDGNLSAGFQSGIQSLTQNLLALPMAFAPGGQGAALSMMTATTGGQSYQDARAKGLSMSQALPFAASQAAIEYATEKLPLGQLIGDVKAGTSIAKTLAKQMALEIPGEQVATALQDMNEWAVLNPEKPFRDYIAERPDAAVQTLIATMVGTGGNVVVAKGVETATRRLMGDAYDADLAENGAEALQQQLAAAMQSKLRERNPDEFRRVVQAMAEQTDGAPAEVYVDAEVLNQLAPEILQQLPQSVLDQLPDALAANDVVSMAVGDVLTLAPGTPLEQMLVENARIGDPSAMSQAEAKAAGEQAQAYLAQEAQRVIAQAQDVQSMQESSERVKQGLFDQLQAVGRFRRDVNEAYATWTTAFYTTMAGRLGLTPEEMAARYPLKIAGQGAPSDVLDTVQQGGLPDVLAEWTAAGIKGDVSEKNGTITLNAIEVPFAERSKGAGSAAMRALVDYADRTGQTIKLGASSQLGGDKARLIEFYQRFGFTVNKRTAPASAKWKDTAMTRDPAKAPQNTAPSNQPDAFNQGPRGTFNPATLELALNENADLSTFLHETGHFFLEVMADLSSQPDAPADIQQDMGKLLRWFGIVADAPVGALPINPVPNRLQLYAKQLGDLAVAQTSGAQGDSVLSFEPLVSVLGEVADAVSDPEVLRAVIASLPVDVVNVLRAKQLSPEDALNDVAVLKNLFTTDDNAGVSVTVDMAGALSSLLRVVADRTAEVPGVADKGGTSFEGVAAGGAGKGNGHSGSKGYDRQQDYSTALAKWNSMSLDEKRPYHERFAESFEEYLLSGKAPSLELQPLFRKFRAWMLNVYKSLKAFLDGRGVAQTGGETLGQPAYHGTPYKFDKFSLDHIGKGEGNQAFGWGLYFAGKKAVAEFYRENLKGRGAAHDGFVDSLPPGVQVEAFKVLSAKPGPFRTAEAEALRDRLGDKWEEFQARLNDKGVLYEVDIPEDDQLLQWDKPITSQPASVKQALKDSGLWKELKDNLSDFGSPMNTRGKLKGENIYAYLQWKLGSDEAASKRLNELGIPGLKYPGGTIAGVKNAGYNYVIFDDKAVEVLQTLAQNGPINPSNIQLSDEIRRVFDRMLAAQDQIAEAERVAGLLPEQDATAEANEKLAARSLRDLKWTVNARAREIKKLQKQAAELRKGIEAEVRAEVEQQPVYKAMRWLKKGETIDEAGNAVKAEKGFRLDTATLAEMYPETMLARPDLAGLKGMTSKTGLHPDIVADMFGFASGDALVRSILDAEPIGSVIEGMTDQRMLEEHGDLVDERAIEQAANEAIHNEARAKSLATELKAQAEALNPRADTGETNAAGSRITVNALTEAAKQFAANVVARTPLRDLKNRAWQHTAAERRAAKRWQEHTAKAETQEAVKAKQDQMLNHAAAKAAMEAQAESKKIIEFFRRVVKDGNEATVEKGRDPDVVNAARAILGAYNVGPQGGKTAIEYLALVEKNDPTMYAALQPSVQVALNMAQPLDALTMEELRGLHEEIQSLWHLAKRSRQMEVDGNLLDMQDAEDELQARMQEIGVPDTMPGDSGAVTPKEEFARKLQHAMSLLRRTEQWAEGMGQEFVKLVFRPVKAAADAYRTDRVKFRKTYQALVDQVAPHMPKGTIAAPELGYTFGQGHNGIGMAELLHAILHTGNASNKRKLLLGRGWATENADGTLDTSKWDAFTERLIDEGVLTKAHYDFAQGVWDLLEQTKPLAQKTHRDVFGRYFAEVTANEFTTPFGTYRGGYVPAQADPRIVQDADLRKLAEAENENMAFSFPATNKGFTKGRVEYNRPLLLDLRTIGQHIDKVLLFSHMEPAVRDVNRLLSRKGVSYSLGRIDPTIYAGMLTPWLNRSAKQIVETPIVGDGGIARVLSTLRARAGMSLMFANVSNTLQQLTGFSTAFAKLKADGLESHMLRATAEFIAHPKTMAKDVAAASPYMANRMENEIAAINDAIDHILLDPNLYQKSQAWFRKHAYFLQSALDNTMGPIIWTAAYNGHLTKHGDEKAAASYADGVIRQTQGSTLPEDVSRIETGPAYARVFTQFIGYFNMMANTNATALKQIAQETGLKKGAGKALLVVTMGLMVPLWVAEAIAIAMRGGPDDEDKDGYLDDWLAAVFGMGTIKGSLAMVPFVGTLANAAINRTNNNPADDKMSLSPAVSLLESAAGVPTDVYKALTDPEKLNKRNAVRDVASAISLSTGLPATAVARPLGYLAGVADDKIEPTSTVDLVRGIITGSASPESK